MGVIRNEKYSAEQYLRSMDRMIESQPHLIYQIEDKRALRDFAKLFGAELIVGDEDEKPKSKGKKPHVRDTFEFAGEMGYRQFPGQRPSNDSENLVGEKPKSKGKKPAVKDTFEIANPEPHYEYDIPHEDKDLLYTKGIGKIPVGGGGKGQKKDGDDARSPHGYASRSRTPKGDWYYKSQSDEVLVVDL